MSHSEVSANGARQGGGNRHSHWVPAKTGNTGPASERMEERICHLTFQLTTTIEIVSTGGCIYAPATNKYNIKPITNRG